MTAPSATGGNRRPRRSHPADPVRESRCRIAIVDDDQPVRSALVRLLSANAFRPTAYQSAREFLAALNCECPDCLLLDVHMPEMDGPELQHHLAVAGRRIPTIMLTAHDDPDLRAHALEAGASEFLVKPVSSAQLFAAISRCIGTRSI